MNNMMPQQQVPVTPVAPQMQQAGGQDEVNAQAQITNVDICNSRFRNDEYVIVLTCNRLDNGEQIEIELDLSCREVRTNDGKDTFIPYIRTSEKLKGIGYQFGDDFSQVETLVDKVVDVYGKKRYSATSGKGYWNWSLSRGHKSIENKEATLAELMKQVRIIRQNREATQQAAPATAPAPAHAPTVSPFQGQQVGQYQQQVVQPVPAVNNQPMVQYQTTTPPANMTRPINPFTNR